MHLERLQMIEVLYRQGVSDFRRASFQQTPVRFGSGKDTDIRLSGLSISRLHAMLEDGPSGLMLRDMGLSQAPRSTNGLSPNTARCRHPTTYALVPGN